MLRPAYATINLDHLGHNMREVRRLVGEKVRVCAVIKADGYGHGATEIGQTLLENGADQFSVATLAEAISLRRAYPEIEILVMGYTPTEDFSLAKEKNITLTLYALDQALAARDLGCKVHVKIDTGMGRLGILPNEEGLRLLEEIMTLEGLTVEGLFTHFARADELDKSAAHGQMEKFQSVLDFLAEKGIKRPMVHAANSAGIIDLPAYHFDMVRAGIMVYGLYPSDEVDKSRVDLKQVMSLHARVAHVKVLPPGEGVSYGHLYKTKDRETIGSLPLGYADGFTRLLTGKARVYLRDTYSPIVGKICMDQMMFLSPVEDLKVDEEVELFGDHIPIDELARTLGTINYEIVCMISKRIPRRYLREGNQIHVRDSILGDSLQPIPPKV